MRPRFGFRRGRWPWLVGAVVAALAVLAGVIIGGSTSNQAESSRASGGTPTGQTPMSSGEGPLRSRPNVVFVLTDDLSLDLLRYMPHVQAMERDGLTFSNYFVSDSLCCPSRASIFTGDFPHDTKVFGNTGRQGGFHVFHDRGEENRTFAVALQRAGYRTALMGKYLNGYLDGQGPPPDVPPTYVPPGWSTWEVAGDGYPEYDYVLNSDGAVRVYGNQPSDYLTDVIARKGIEFIDQSAAARRPFFLELSTFAPHSPFVPAPRDASAFPGLRAPRPPSFDVLPTHAPRWLKGHPPLSFRQIAHIDRIYRRRAQSVRAVDLMIGQIEADLRSKGIAENTYIVFSSDNGLHTGQYRLAPGKLTAFDTDIHVPLVVVGPGVPAGARTEQMTENIDLAPTFAALGGTAVRADGRSLLPLLRRDSVRDWRNAILVEHKGPRLGRNDPDFQQSASGDPTSYEAIRTRRYLYVEYRDGEREYYDLVRDPFELHNLAGTLPPRTVSSLHRDLTSLKRCHHERACSAADHVPRAP
ncbi:MAG: sulfatase [Actinomycetota bacterium]|nr:sulfatase [Actinomycetota bacterium]